MRSVYLDVCAIQRPLDDLQQPRVAAEARAVEDFLQLCMQGRVVLISSSAVELELGRITDPARMEFTSGVMRLASRVDRMTPQVNAMWSELCSEGVKPLDALHVAFAIEGQIELFCTCDDRLLTLLKRLNLGSLLAVSPLDLLKELSP